MVQENRKTYGFPDPLDNFFCLLHSKHHISKLSYDDYKIDY